MDRTDAEHRKKRVVFVCTGNTCRSPIAEGVFRALLPRGRRESVEVFSAGTDAVFGVAATEEAVRAASEQGIDIRGHRSRPLTRELVFAADLVVVMSRRHAESVRREAPEAAGKILLLGDLLPATDPSAGKDLPDPFGGPLEAYRGALEAIRSALRLGWPRIEARLFGGGAEGGESV